MHKEQKSMVFVSDDLDNDKTSVCVYMHKVLVKLTTENAIKKVDIFSDGPSSQFKNQYVFNYLPSLYEQYNLDCLNWKFFATSHRKGAVDGIGGAVKRNVWMETLSRQEVVISLEDFCQVAMKKDGKVEVIAVSAEEIETCADEIALDDIFAASTSVDSIKKMHYVTVLANGKIKCKEFTNKVDIQGEAGASGMTEPDGSDLDEWYDKECEKHAPQVSNEINEEDFVICRYEGELFPGQVTKVYSMGARVKAMEKCAGGWRWPKQVDEIDYLAQDIVQKIEFPEPINNWGTFKVKELESRWEY